MAGILRRLGDSSAKTGTLRPEARRDRRSRTHRKVRREKKYVAPQFLRFPETCIMAY